MNEKKREGRKFKPLKLQIFQHTEKKRTRLKFYKRIHRSKIKTKSPLN